jgi:hypothetical protein
MSEQLKKQHTTLTTLRKNLKISAKSVVSNPLANLLHNLLQLTTNKMLQVCFILNKQHNRNLQACSK